MADDGAFDGRIAETYDARHLSDPAALAAMVEALAELAAGGAALEFAIGTGRVALQLATRGLQVCGIELSRAMVRQLEAKPGGDAIPVTIGDMATARHPGAFSLVFLVYNTIDNLTTQSAQCACFANAAAHLAPGGRFVVETFVPPLRRLGPGTRLLAFDRSDDHWGTDEFDTADQTYTSHHLWLRDGETQRFSLPFRYAWPAEMDLMARLAGLELESRWADWSGAAFTDASDAHVSVWRKPAG